MHRPKNVSKREISAGFIVFRRFRGGRRYLLLHHGGNYWNFPKGHIEKNESEIKAAFRETREETGLKRIRQILGFKRYEKYFLRRGKRKFVFKLVIYFIVEAGGNEKVRISNEHEGFGWFSFADALKKMKYKESRKLLQDAHEFLTVGLHPLAQDIYQLAKKIPAGKITTYGAIARALNKPEMSRFVGTVLNKNTDESIPCHRIVKQNGEVGGYNKGAAKKIAILKREGVIVKNGLVDLLKFGFRFRGSRSV